MSLPLPPPARMNVFDAKRYALPSWLGGYGLQIRRINWNVASGSPVAPNEYLRWFVYRGGKFYVTGINGSGAYDHEVTTADFTQADIEAADWTVEGIVADVRDWTNPNQARLTELAAGGSGSSDSGSGGSSGSSRPSSGWGGSGGTGSGGASTPMPKPKAAKVDPGVTVAVSRTSGDTCIALDGGVPSTDPITDTFDVSIALDAAAPPGLYDYKITYGTPRGFKTSIHGMMAPGDTKSGTISITARAGQSFGVFGYARKLNTSIYGSDRQTAEMRPNCDPSDPPGCPVIDITGTPGDRVMMLGESPTLLGGATTTGGHTLTYEWYRNGALVGSGTSYVIEGATAEDAGLWELRVTSDCGSVRSIVFEVAIDDGSGGLLCAPGWHYDSGAMACVPD